jgi:CO/xanthine dehydrogenase FAD-binding subunit
LSDAQAFLKDVGFAQPFFKALKTLGSPQIRNQATIGGSILWNHPSSDLWPLYISLVHTIRSTKFLKD